jgi:hypothetical protein
MYRRRLLAVLLCGSMLSGCSLLDWKKSEATAPKLHVAAPPPVRPDHVTTQNAIQKARELNEELDRELEDLP